MTGIDLDLETLGWDAGWQDALDTLADGRLVPGRVAVQHRGAYDVATAAGERRSIVPTRLVREARERAELPAVGDWVALDPTPSDHAVIEALLPRRTKFSRLASHDSASDTTVEQVVAANVDVVFVVTSLNEELSTRRLERYLTLAWQSGARPVILLTKADLVSDPAAALARVETVALGVTIHLVSAPTGTGLASVVDELGAGVTGALLGSSGVGKSTLVNALTGEARMETAAIRADGKGRHTTSHRQLIVLPDDAGLLIDTPGMRELQLWVADEGLDEAFEDVTALFDDCRFSDCAHEREPGCAVQEALADRRLAVERWESYTKLQRELVALERRLDRRAQVDEKRRWKLL